MCICTILPPFPSRKKNLWEKNKYMTYDTTESNLNKLMLDKLLLYYILIPDCAYVHYGTTIWTTWLSQAVDGCKIYEIRFYEPFRSRLQKVLIWSKKLFWQKCNMGIKKRWFRIRLKSCKKNSLLL